MIVETLYSTINKGKLGKNIGLSTGLEKLDKLTYGLNRGWMYVWAGDSGSGKSSIVLYSTIYQPFMQYLQDKSIEIHFLLFSFELSAEVLLTKLLSIYIWDTFHKELSYEKILSLREPISEEDYQYIEKSKNWLEELEKHCEIVDKPVTAKHLYGICKEWAKKYGTFKEEGKVGEYTKEMYIPNNSQQYLIVNVDHIKLLKTDSGNGVKQEIDDASNYLITLRNKCNFTVNIVQQLNRNFKSVARKQLDGVSNKAALQLDDLGDSSGPTQSAELVIGIWHPFRERQNKCEGYDIRQLMDNVRMLCILKHRYGMADRVIGCNFFGSVGVWKTLPLPQEINDYEPYTHLR